jgi:hypothetical protein
MPASLILCSRLPASRMVSVPVGDLDDLSHEGLCVSAADEQDKEESAPPHGLLAYSDEARQDEDRYPTHRGLADGFVFTLPAESVPPFIGVGPVARYQRVAGNGEVICYRFADSGPFGPN